MAQKDIGNKTPLHELKTTEQVMKYYDEWSKNNKYNQDMFEWEYSGPKETSETLSKYQNNKDIKIYDAGCGSGLVGIELKKYGFNYFDGADISKELLNQVPDNLYNIISIQNKILENSAKILKKNGLMMYVTCSLQKIEGERRIEDFLKSHKQFSIVSFNSEDFPKINDSITKEGFIRILPNHFNFNFENVSNGSDGFFIALLKKEK